MGWFPWALRQKDKHTCPAGGSRAAQNERFRVPDYISHNPMGFKSKSYRIAGFAVSDSPFSIMENVTVYLGGEAWDLK